jgi:hypothetical protein
VEYEIRPREKTETQIGGSWDFKDDVMLNGTVAPDPGRGTVCIRLDFQNQQGRWQSVLIAPGGKSHRLYAPQNSLVLNVIAWFEGVANSALTGRIRQLKLLGAAMMVNRVKYLGPELKVKEVGKAPESAPDASRGRRKTHVFRRADFRTEIAILYYI